MTEERLRAVCYKLGATYRYYFISNMTTSQPVGLFQTHIAPVIRTVPKTLSPRVGAAGDWYTAGRPAMTSRMHFKYGLCKCLIVNICLTEFNADGNKFRWTGCRTTKMPSP